MAAYADAIERCNTEVAPWHVVPADRKWYRNWAVTNAADRAARGAGAALAGRRSFDVEAERARAARDALAVS